MSNNHPLRPHNPNRTHPDDNTNSTHPYDHNSIHGRPLPPSLELPLPSNYVFPAFDASVASAESNDAGSIMQMGRSPPNIPPPGTRRTATSHQHLRYDSMTSEMTMGASGIHLPSTMFERDSLSQESREALPYYGMEGTATAAALSLLEEGRTQYQPDAIPRSLPGSHPSHPDHAYIPQHLNMSRRSSSASIGNGADPVRYPGFSSDARYHSSQRRYTPEIPISTRPGASLPMYQTSRVSSALSQSSALSHTSAHGSHSLLRASSPAIAFLHPSKSQQVQIPSDLHLRKGTPTPCAQATTMAAASARYQNSSDLLSPFELEHESGRLGDASVTVVQDADGAMSIGDVTINQATGDTFTQGGTITPEASGSTDDIATSNLIKCIDERQSTRTLSEASPNEDVTLPSNRFPLRIKSPASIADDQSNHPCPLDEHLFDEDMIAGTSGDLSSRVAPSSEGFSDKENHVPKIGDEITYGRLSNRSALVATEADLESEMRDADDQSTDGKRRLTEATRRDLHTELDAVDRAFKDIAERTGFTMEQVSAVYHARNANVSHAPNYWNLYTVWFSDHALEECRRIHPDTPDESINTAISAQDRSRCFVLFKKEYGERYQEILSSHHDLRLLSSPTQTVAQRIKSFRKLCDRYEILAKAAHRQYGFETAFVVTGSNAHQDDKVGRVFESAGLYGFFKRVSRSDGEENEILAHAKAHAVWKVSESVLDENHYETPLDSDTGHNPAATSEDHKMNQNDPVVLATDDEIDEMIDDQLLKYIKSRFNGLLESVGLDPAPAGNFPWRTLPTKLADSKLTLHGWPRRCRHPGNEEQGNKGISSLHLYERRILAKAFDDNVHPLTLRNMKEPDSYLKKNGLLVAIEGAPPLPNENDLRGTRTLVQKQNHKTVTSDNKGLDRLEMITDTSPSPPRDVPSKSKTPDVSPSDTTSILPSRKRKLAPPSTTPASEREGTNDDVREIHQSPSGPTTRGQSSRSTVKRVRLEPPVTPEAARLSPQNSATSDESVVIVGHKKAPPRRKLPGKKKVVQPSAAATTVRRRPVVEVPPAPRSFKASTSKRRLQLSEGETDGANAATPKPSTRTVLPRPAYNRNRKAVDGMDLAAGAGKSTDTAGEVPMGLPSRDVGPGHTAQRNRASTHGSDSDGREAESSSSRPPPSQRGGGVPQQQQQMDTVLAMFSQMSHLINQMTLPGAHAQTPQGSVRRHGPHN